MPDPSRYLMIPASLEAIVGICDKGTRIYRASGTDAEAVRWFDAICDCFIQERFITIGAVGIFAPVSRAAVHKRLREGKLTLFFFQVIGAANPRFGYQKKAKRRPYGLIPVSECRAWAEELNASPARRRHADERASVPRPAAPEDEFLD